MQFDNEGTLEPLPMVMERTVVMWAEGLTKSYPAVTGGGLVVARWSFFETWSWRFMRGR